MSNEMITQNETNGNGQLGFVENKPSDVVIRATEAAKTLQKIVNDRSKKLVLGGKQYLYYEDWQTLAKFDNITAKVVSTEEIRENDKLIGFSARAVALKNGEEISAAEAECCFDEPNWNNKPRFQLKSMAQTRACSKALRNVLAFIAVLANYEPTPAEEMDGVVVNGNNYSQHTTTKPTNTKPATQKQLDMIFGYDKDGEHKKGIIESHLIQKKEVDKIQKLYSEGKLDRSKASEIIGWWIGDNKKGIEGERDKRQNEESLQIDQEVAEGEDEGNADFDPAMFNDKVTSKS